MTFDRLAAVYDQLAGLIFGQLLQRAQNHFAGLVKEGDRVLILGSGSRPPLSYGDRASHIVCLDKSQKMLDRINSSIPIERVHADFLEWQSEDRFDWIFCPFFLDCFSDENLRKVIDQMVGLFSDQGRLVITDFQIVRPRHRWLVRTMYLFFRLTTRLEARRLPEFKRHLTSDFEIVAQEDFGQGLVFSWILEKKGKPFLNSSVFSL